MRQSLPWFIGISAVHHQPAGSAAAAVPAHTKALRHSACGKYQSSSPCCLQQAILLRPVQSNLSALHTGSDCRQCHSSPFYRQPQAAPSPLPSSPAWPVRCSIKGSMTSRSPCYRSSAAPAPQSRPKALSAGRSAARGSLGAGRPRQVPCRARRMSTEEACALLGIRGSCSREELRAAYLALMKEVGKHLPAACDMMFVRIQSDHMHQASDGVHLRGVHAYNL